VLRRDLWELFHRLSRSIWSELGQKGGPHPNGPRNIESVRRDLQRLHLNAMVRMLLSPAPGTPEDARSLARATLTDLAGGIDHALDEARDDLDDYTRAHLADSRERIARALDAPMVETASTR